MKKIALYLWLISGATSALWAALEYGEKLAHPELEKRARQLYSEIRCPVCVSQSLDGSQAHLAKELRSEIRQLLLAGKSNDEITEILKLRYNEAISYTPPFVPQTYILWGLPFILMAAGIYMVVWRARHCKKSNSDPT